MRARVHEEAGFSMIELVVAMTVGLLVLGVAYVVMDGARTTADRVYSGAQENRYAAGAIDKISRYGRELHNIYRAEDYLIDFTADYNNDGNLDRFVYQIDSQNRLLETISNPNTGQELGRRFLAENVRNRIDGVPLFRYWKSVDVPAAGNAAYSPPKDGERLTKSQLLSIELAVRVKGGPEHGTQRLRTDVFLRNRLY